MTASLAVSADSEPADAWEKIFALGAASLTEAEQEQALKELAQAVRAIEQMQARPEHSRVKAMIERKMNTQ